MLYRIYIKILKQTYHIDLVLNSQLHKKPLWFPPPLYILTQQKHVELIKKKKKRWRAERRRGNPRTGIRCQNAYVTQMRRKAGWLYRGPLSEPIVNDGILSLTAF